MDKELESRIDEFAQDPSKGVLAGRPVRRGGGLTSEELASLAEDRGPEKRVPVLLPIATAGEADSPFVAFAVLQDDVAAELAARGETPDSVVESLFADRAADKSLELGE